MTTPADPRDAVPSSARAWVLLLLAAAFEIVFALSTGAEIGGGSASSIKPGAGAASAAGGSGGGVSPAAWARADRAQALVATMNRPRARIGPGPGRLRPLRDRCDWLVTFRGPPGSIGVARPRSGPAP